MFSEDLTLRLLEQAELHVGSDQFLIVLMGPADENWLTSLLTKRFPQAGVILDAGQNLDASVDRSRIGSRSGPYLAEWTMPARRFGHIVVLGARSQMGLRAVKAAFSQGVRWFLFADPLSEKLSTYSILSLGLLHLVARLSYLAARLWHLGLRVVAPVRRRAASVAAIWNRKAAEVRAASNRVKLILRAKLKPAATPKAWYLGKTRWERQLLYFHGHVAQFIRRGFWIFEALSIAIRSRTNAGRFQDTLENLFRFAERTSPGVEGAPRDSVILTIGTVGPGGSERQVVNTAIALAASGRWRPIVVCTNLGGEASDFYRATLEAAGVALVDLRGASTEHLPLGQRYVIAANDKGDRELSLGHKHFIAACRATFEAEDFDITSDVIALLTFIFQENPAIVHSFLDDTNIKSGVAAVLARVPKVILSLRSVAPNNFSLHTPFMRPGYKALVKQSEVRLCANSSAGAADYRKWLENPALPIDVVENGVNFDQFVRRPEVAANKRAELKIPPDSLVLGSVMRMTEEKQPMLWAKVVVEISRQLPDMHFVLAGDGPMRTDVMNYVANARLSNRAHFPGRVKDVPATLSCFDLFLLTSRLEGLPNVLIEAQAMGVPVVTTPAGGAAETLSPGHTGLVAPDQTVEGVAETCLKLLTNRTLLAQMAAASPGFVHQKFSVERMLDRTLQLYR